MFADDASSQENLLSKYTNARAICARMTDPEALYERGMLLASDENEDAYLAASDCFMAAATRNHTQAQIELGKMYEYGRGVPQSDIFAYKWYQTAVLLGDKSAVTPRNRLENAMSIDDIAMSIPLIQKTLDLLDMYAERQDKDLEAKEKELEWVVAYRNFLRENLPEGWQFRLRGGVEYRSTSSSIMSAYAAFDTIKEWDLNKFTATAYYNYTKQTSADNVTDVTLDKYGVDTAFRRDFNESRHWYFQNILNYKRDTVKGIRDQVDEAATFGYRFDFKRYDLIIDIAPGPAVRYINAENYDTKWVAMAVLAENITWKISNLLRFEQNGYLGFNLQNPEEYSANLGLGLILKATDVMEIALRYSYSYDAINASSNQMSEQTLLLSFEFPFNWKY